MDRAWLSVEDGLKTGDRPSLTPLHHRDIEEML